MSEFIIQGSTITALADAIRAKTGSADALSLEQITAKIAEMETGGSEEDTLNEYISGNLTKYSNNIATSIIHYAFYSNFSLTSASFTNCTTIGSNAFAYCTNLTSIDFPVCKVLGSSAFYSCSSLTSVSFPACISIGNDAFYSCSKLSSINFTNCTSIGSGAFFYCSSLTTVSFPACTSVGNGAFRSCSSLTSVNFPKLNSLAMSMFAYCSNLIDVNIPSCTTIESNAFFNCSKLQSISIPKVTALSSYAFAGCSSLKSISLPRVNTTGTYVFQSCYQLTDVDFSFGAVGTGTFQYCSALTNVNLTGCSVIYSYAFQGCNSLTNINLPKCISIYASAFQNCKSLSSVNLSKCSYIASYVFSGCSNLTTLVLQSTSVCSLYRSNAFTSTPIASKMGYIFVPSGLVSLYKSASYWSYFSTQIVALGTDIRVPGPIEDSWETISEISKSGNAEDNYLIGDTKDITLATGEVITLQIIGFNHDTLSDGTGTAGITFQMKNCLAEGQGINATSGNTTGWTNSLMRSKLQPNGQIFESLPEELKNVIRPVDKITSIGGQSTTLGTTSDYGFLLSEMEIFGSATNTVSGEGVQYAYYKNGGNKTKSLANGAGSVIYWWSRSPAKRATTWFNVSTSGGTSLGASSNNDGISFAFCV